MKDGPETEAKYRLRPGQREAIAQRLASHPHRTMHHEDTYFEVGDRVLRIRIEDDQAMITAKNASTPDSMGIKARQEVEFPIPGELAPKLEWLFPWMGHRKLTIVRKTRIEYDLCGASVTLDTVVGLSDVFAEIEVLDDPDAAGRIELLRGDLGLDPSQIESKSYAKLVAEQTSV